VFGEWETKPSGLTETGLSIRKKEEELHEGWKGKIGNVRNSSEQ